MDFEIILAFLAPSDGKLEKEIVAISTSQINIVGQSPFYKWKAVNSTLILYLVLKRSRG
jgi:hypothetical protein